MKTLFTQSSRMLSAAVVMLLSLMTYQAHAAISGISGGTSGTLSPVFDLTVSATNILTPDGDSVYIWGYGVDGGTVQYPGPTLFISQGATVTVNLTNSLPGGAPMPVSIIFPGQGEVVATGGSAGLLTRESTGSADTVTYTFTASMPGTYMYQSGTRPGLQVEMGLVGALIVRPTGWVANDGLGGGNTTAYGHADTAYDHEYLLLLSEMNPAIHQLVEFGLIDQVDNTLSRPTLWFINGRNGLDTLFPGNPDWLPYQPYSSLLLIKPGERTLARFIGGGKDLHPFHPHGNFYDVIARDGRMLTSDPDNPLVAGADLSYGDYTLPVKPGTTVDYIWEWTGKGLNWDLYGHQPSDVDNMPEDGVNYPFPGVEDIDLGVPGLYEPLLGDVDNVPVAGINYPFPYGTDVDQNGNGTFDPAAPLAPAEYAPDHQKPLPVILPDNKDLAFGPIWRGSPFLGVPGVLPPGEAGLNLWDAVVQIWHSHSEIDLLNNGIFPGGMLTLVVIMPPSIPTAALGYSPF